MRLKPLPELPADLEDRTVFDAVAAAQSAVPLVPGTENDCCARLMRREGYGSRDVARSWLTFLRALELAEETDAGFKRTDHDPTPGNVRESFRERVFGAPETLAVLREAEEPLTAGTVFDRLRETVPGWERHRRNSWVDHWEARTERLLDWLVLLDLADRADDGYIATD
ncbi:MULTISPECIES: hypothetical protein [Halolamina]|uniref:Uncharacterized protein n=1 Tax=Halolamina pelagica TaxID=699431 RepID=A0A1I5P519_9EURY|nr:MULTISPECIES: hypothetical protein [Halolamina]NHX36630.1 hypothetical protein [Halolamina sp. R1-12]SFP29053.1 hypothetical protein SAMN05216277_102352 [Halolamina pelagica]